MIDAFIEIDGLALPYPNKDSGLQTQITLVDGSRNQNGVFIGQKVGRDQSKVELQWYSMQAGLWSQLLKLLRAKVNHAVKYYDMAEGTIITREMYVSDRSARPKRIDPHTGVWLIAADCKLSLVDTGR